MTENNQNPTQPASGADHVMPISGTDDFTMTEAGLERLLFRLYTKDAGKPVPAKPSMILTGALLDTLGIMSMETWELPDDRLLLARRKVTRSGRIDVRASFINKSSASGQDKRVLPIAALRLEEAGLENSRGAS